MSQRELARRTGIRQPNIAAYESGRRAPTEQTLARLLAGTRLRQSEVLAGHRDEVLQAARRHLAGNVRAFGSTARGDDTPSSDVDLIVAFEPEASLSDLAELVDDLSALLGRRVDVISERGLNDRDQHILAEAIPL